MADKIYQQTSGYIPSTDSGFRSWLANFSGLISADANRYNLTGADAAIIAGLYSDYSTLFDQVQAPSTRTPGLIAQKDAVKASAIATVRVYAMQIKANKGITNQDKVDLGLHVNDNTPTPIPAPSSAPLLAIQGAFSGAHIIRFADENTPTSRAKPHGVIQLELYVHVGPQPIVDWEEASFAGVFTKNPIDYTFNPSKAGQTATYFARWRTRRGLVGPMSLPVAMMIAFGGPVDQQVPTGGTFAAGDEDVHIAA